MKILNLFGRSLPWILASSFLIVTATLSAEGSLSENIERRQSWAKTVTGAIFIDPEPKESSYEILMFDLKSITRKKCEELKKNKTSLKIIHLGNTDEPIDFPLNEIHNIPHIVFVSRVSPAFLPLHHARYLPKRSILIPDMGSTLEEMKLVAKTLALLFEERAALNPTHAIQILEVAATQKKISDFYLSQIGSGILNIPRSLFLLRHWQESQDLSVFTAKELLAQKAYRYLESRKYFDNDFTEDEKKFASQMSEMSQSKSFVEPHLQIDNDLLEKMLTSDLGDSRLSYRIELSVDSEEGCGLCYYSDNSMASSILFLHKAGYSIHSMLESTREYLRPGEFNKLAFELWELSHPYRIYPGKDEIISHYATTLLKRLRSDEPQVREQAEKEVFESISKKSFDQIESLLNALSALDPQWKRQLKDGSISGKCAFYYLSSKIPDEIQNSDQVNLNFNDIESETNPTIIATLTEIFSQSHSKSFALTIRGDQYFSAKPEHFVSLVSQVTKIPSIQFLSLLRYAHERFPTRNERFQFYDKLPWEKMLPLIDTARQSVSSLNKRQADDRSMTTDKVSSISGIYSHPLEKKLSDYKHFGKIMDEFLYDDLYSQFVSTKSLLTHYDLVSFLLFTAELPIDTFSPSFYLAPLELALVHLAKINGETRYEEIVEWALVKVFNQFKNSAPIVEGLNQILLKTRQMAKTNSSERKERIVSNLLSSYVSTP